MKRFPRTCWLLLVPLSAFGAAGCSGCDRDKPEVRATTPAATRPGEGASRAPAPPADIGDQQLADAVTKSLERDPGVKLEGVRVKVTDGIVELTGKARDLLTSRRAVRVAELVRGVRAVSDRLDVAVEPRPDPELEANIESALLSNAAADSYEIEAKANDGTVTLTGKVQSFQESQAAQRVAEGVVGVKNVKNELAIDYGAKRHDAEIRADVESRLRWDALVNDGMINVAVRDGKVELSGTVSSAAERRRAISDGWVRSARWVDGHALKVAWKADEQQLTRHKRAEKTDEEIQKAIRHALTYDPRVSAANVDVKVSGGVAMLSGEVQSVAASFAAEDLARRTVGVTRFTNQISVEPGKAVPDATLQRNVTNSLLWDPYTDSYQITVLAKGGKVTLTGKVDTAFERAQATTVVSEIEGVKDLDNRLKVARDQVVYVFEPYHYPYSPYIETWRYAPRTTTRSDTDIAREIRDELFWSPFVDVDDVTVQVKDGKATLTGRVDGYSELSSATENALEGGAIAVENRLRIEPR